MKIAMSGRKFKLTTELQEHVDRRVRFALGRFGTVVDRVDVSLSDVNGPRGGLDKRCQIVVKTRGAGEVVVDDHDRDLYAAVSRASDRIGRAVARTLERKRDVKSYHRRRMLVASEETTE